LFSNPCRFAFENGMLFGSEQTRNGAAPAPTVAAATQA
jgi:hypothetical protein